jgi:hypothetical protein
MMRKITKYDVVNGRFAELLYRGIAELASGARGGVVALRTPKFTDDHRAVPHVSAALAELARRLGAEEWRTDKGVAYIVPTEKLRRLSLRDVEEAVEAARRSVSVKAKARAAAQRQKAASAGGGAGGGGDARSPHSCGNGTQDKEPVRGETRIVDVKVPPEMLRRLKKLVKEGYFVTVSDAVRAAILLLILKYRYGEGV